eukprot:263183_1
MTFASDLQTQSLPTPLTYIFYASTKSTFIDNDCTRFPRICKYPLTSELHASIQLDTSADKIYIDHVMWGVFQWWGVGMGPMGGKGYAIMTTSNAAPPILPGIWAKEFILANHTSPSPAPPSVYADTTQNLTNS